MSVLNTRTFILPLLEKRNIIAILLVALFFGIFRLSGGGVDVSKLENGRAVQSGDAGERSTADEFAPSSPIEEIRKLQLKNKPADKTGAPSAKLSDNTNDLFGLLEQKPAKPVQQDTAGEDRYDQLERTLGLR